jgi:uncharacterized protein (TIGR03643 family)
LELDFDGNYDYFGTEAVMTKRMKNQGLSEADKSSVIEMALSDHVSFETIQSMHGLRPDAVKLLMRDNLKPGSYRAWRKRVADFGSRRARYKSALPISMPIEDDDFEIAQA